MVFCTFDDCVERNIYIYIYLYIYIYIDIYRYISFLGRCSYVCRVECDLGLVDRSG